MTERRFDETPLPPPRPPTMEISLHTAARRQRSVLPWIIALVCALSTWAAMRELRAVEDDDHRAIAAARDEAAEHREKRFAAEAEAQKLAAENARLRALQAPDAGAIRP